MTVTHIPFLAGIDKHFVNLDIVNLVFNDLNTLIVRLKTIS